MFQKSMWQIIETHPPTNIVFCMSLDFALDSLLQPKNSAVNMGNSLMQHLINEIIAKKF